MYSFPKLAWVLELTSYLFDGEGDTKAMFVESIGNNSEWWLTQFQQYLGLPTVIGYDNIAFNMCFWFLLNIT